MLEINREKNLVTLKLSKKLYPSEVIEKAISDFAIETEKKDSEDHTVLSFPAGKEQDAEELGLEFCNYLLGLIKGS